MFLIRAPFLPFRTSAHHKLLPFKLCSACSGHNLNSTWIMIFFLFSFSPKKIQFLFRQKLALRNPTKLLPWMWNNNNLINRFSNFNRCAILWWKFVLNTQLKVFERIYEGWFSLRSTKMLIKDLNVTENWLKLLIGDVDGPFP